MNISLLKEKLTKIIGKRYFPILVFGIIMFVLHLIIETDFGDDLIFAQSLDELSLLEFLKARYLTWSSRIFIEAVLVTLVKIPFLWKLLNTGICVLIVYALSKLFVKENAYRSNIIICCLFFMYPFLHMNTAGWMATTINYLWPLALGLISFIPLKKVFLGQSFQKWEYALFSTALLFAANLEQMGAVIFGVYASFTLVFYLIRKKEVYIWIQTGLSFISLLFILLSPGNDVRYEKEVATWFPDFESLPFFRKFEMGFSSTLFHYIMTPNVFFGAFCAIIFIFVFIKYKDRLHRSIAFIPLLISCVFGVFGPVFGEIFPGIGNVITCMTEYGTGVLLTSLKSWGPDLILLLACGTLIYSLLFIFENKLQGLFAVFLLLIGFCSRVIIGFTPTIWGSGERTYLFMYFSMIIVLVLLYNQISKPATKKYQTLFENIIYVVAGLSFLNTFYLIQ